MKGSKHKDRLKESAIRALCAACADEGVEPSYYGQTEQVVSWIRFTREECVEVNKSVDQLVKDNQPAGFDGWRNY